MQFIIIDLHLAKEINTNMCPNKIQNKQDSMKLGVRLSINRLSTILVTSGMLIRTWTFPDKGIFFHPNFI